MKRINLYLLLGSLVFFSVIFVVWGIYLIKVNSEDYASIVMELPEGYISYDDLMERYGDKISIFGFETQICVFDMDENNLMQTFDSDTSFSVKYKNKWYYNEETIKELLPLAK